MLFTRCERVEFNDFVSAAGLLQKGFREVEELVTWVRSPAHYGYEGVRKAKWKEIFRCMMIARDAFDYDRRHWDKDYPDWVADLSKMWAVARGFYKPALTVFVADIDGVLGFLICDRIEKKGVRIDLIAVDRRCRRQGVGDNLVAKGLDYYARQGCSYILAGTQAHNVASCKFYESLGFVIGRRQRTFHR
jgi:ribosomal protein S18 acetylase RimI-like enzyme